MTFLSDERREVYSRSLGHAIVVASKSRYRSSTSARHKPSVGIQRREAEEVTMSPESLRVRVERLERRVEILEQLPERVSALESQIVLLRGELRNEFSATRALISDVDRYMRMLHEDVIQRIATLGEGRNR